MSDYTQEQQNVIDNFGKNMLVSASAGSGKTRVLIAKITKILIEELANIKDLLVVTFTNAACDEIKQRLHKVLVESNDAKLYDQIDDLSVCDILTFDSFCKKVVEEFGFQIGIGGGFGVADNSLSAFLKNKALDNLLARHSQMQTPEYLGLLNLFFQNRNDKILRETIISLHSFIVNHQGFDEFFEILQNIYTENFEDSIAIKYAKREFDFYLNSYNEQLNKLMLESEMLKNESLANNINHTKELLKNFGNDYFVNMFYYLNDFEPKRIADSKNDTAEILEIKQKYKLATKLFKQSLSSIFSKELKDFEANDIKKFLKNDKNVLDYLLSITKEFDEEYKRQKKNYNVLDFVDLEKCALQILDSASISMSLKNKYKFIFVDEYQDTSKLQNDIIEKVTTGTNLMMVGDVKQSIYAYRNAEPQIFLNKYDDFKSDVIKNSLFELNKNFRSEKKVLDFANFIFDLIMQKELDGIDYKLSSNLMYGETIPTQNKENFIDVLLIEKEKTEKASEKFHYYSVKNDKLVFDESSGIEKEAKLVAKKIVEYVSNKHYWNADNQKFQPITYGDIAILTRDQKDVILKVRKVLNSAGIPVKCKFDDNLMQNFDMKLLISILHLINNVNDDYNLIVGLTSIVGNLSFDEVSQIRLFDKKSEYFYQSVKNYCEQKNDILSKKIEDFYKKIENYRTISCGVDICELLSLIVRNEQIDKYFWLNDYGKQFDEHFRLLISSYQSIKNYSLTEFIQFIDQSTDEKVTNQISDAENAVTISTIHASKGLEYPAVFILQGGKNITLRPQQIYCDSQLGISKQSINLIERTKFDNPITMAFKLKMLNEQKKDEKRLLYVALTRAKNYLTIIGTINTENIAPIENLYDLKLANSYLDWITGALSRHDIDCLINKGNFEKKIGDGAMARYNIVEIDETVQIAQDKQTKFDEIEYSSNNFEKIINKKFIHSQLAKKNSVSQIMQDEEHYNISNFSAYEEDISGDNDFLAIGTAYHRFMELLNFSHNENGIKKQIDELVEKNKISKAELDMVDIQKLTTACAEIAKLIEPEDIVLKEQQFLCYMPASELIKTSETNKILVQGVADLIIIKNKEIILIDYKTSRFNDERDFVSKYSTQLNIYSKALQDFYRDKVSKKYVYSFHLNKLILIA